MKFLKQHWDGPIVLKGIQSVMDMKKAAEFGMQRRWSSRQLESLPAFVDTVDNKLAVFFDSGVQLKVRHSQSIGIRREMRVCGEDYTHGEWVSRDRLIYNA